MLEILKLELWVKREILDFHKKKLSRIYRFLPQSDYCLDLSVKIKFSRAIFGNGNWLILVINFTIFENFVPNLTIYAVMLHRAKYLKRRKNKLISTITFRQWIYILRILFICKRNL